MRRLRARGFDRAWACWARRLEYPMAAVGAGHQRVCELLLRHAQVRYRRWESASVKQSNPSNNDSSGKGGASLHDAAHGCLWAVVTEDHDMVDWLLKCVETAQQAEQAAQGPHVVPLRDGAAAAAVPPPPPPPRRRKELWAPPIHVCSLLGYGAYGCDLPTLRRVHQLCEATYLAERRYTRRDTHGGVALDWLGHLDWAMAGAMASPTPDWWAKVGWLVGEVGYQRGRGELVAWCTGDALPAAAERIPVVAAVVES